MLTAKSLPKTLRSHSLFPVASASAHAPATCGELVQGVLPETGDFLINCPIELFSSVRAALRPQPVISVRNRGDYEKCKLAARRTLDYFGLQHLGARLEVTSAIPRGKGLASSTSEIAATARAIAEACGESLPHSVMSSIAVSIESSDGVYLEGVTQYWHLSGRTISNFGAPPLLHILIVDCGGEIITADFDRELFRANARCHEQRMRAILRLLKEGFRRGDGRRIARAATESARLNQKVHFKECFEDLGRVAEEAGAFGVNCAHSGTVLGVLFDPTITMAESLLSRVESFAGARSLLGIHALIGGGTRVSGAIPTSL